MELESEIDDKWLKNMQEIYKRYEKFDLTYTSSIKCIIFFISKNNEVSEVIKKKYRLSNNNIDYNNIVKIVQDYSNNYRILDVLQCYMPYDHESIEKQVYKNEPLKIKKITDQENIYFPNTTIYMKNLSNLIIFCKEKSSLSLLTKKINIKENKKTRKNKMRFFKI